MPSGCGIGEDQLLERGPLDGQRDGEVDVVVGAGITSSEHHQIIAPATVIVAAFMDRTCSHVDRACAPMSTAALSVRPVPVAERRDTVTVLDAEQLDCGATDSVSHRFSKGETMAKTTVEVLVDDLDGSEGAETVRLGWDGEWRELELSKRNLASLSRVLTKYWNAARPVAGDRQPKPRRPAATTSRNVGRDPKVIRAWATENGIDVAPRGRVPADVERRFNEARRS